METIRWSRAQGRCSADPVTANMPGADVDVSGRLVSDLLEAQRPDLTGLAVVPIGFGWDNFSFHVGDDLVIAWMLFGPEAREVFRNAYGDVDETTWERARGWALSLAVAFLANSADNEEMESIGRVTLGRVLEDR